MATLAQAVVAAHSSSGVTGLGVAFGSNVTAGNLIAVTVQIAELASSSSASVTVSDTLSNTYTLAARAPTVSADTTNVLVFYAKNITGGACTVTATSSSSRKVIVAYEFAGLDTTTPVEDTATNSGNSAAPTAGNVDTAGAGALVAVAHNFYNYTTLTAGSGWTGTTTTDVWYKFESQYRLVGSGGSYAAEFVQGAAYDYGAAAVAFKNAGGGGGSSIAAISNRYLRSRRA
jgi:hypothetical protein